MENPFRQKIKDYFDIIKSDRSAVLAIAVLILITIAGKFIASKIEFKPDSDFSEFKRIIDEWESMDVNNSGSKSLFTFDPNTVSEESLDSLDLPDFVKRNILNYRAAGGRFNDAGDLRRIYGMNDSIFFAVGEYIQIPRKETFQTASTVSKETTHLRRVRFDPNTADEKELRSAGFSAFQASNLVKYRANGGAFNRAEDLLKIYGIDSLFFSSIEYLIQITAKPVEKVESAKPLPMLVDLNSADSDELQKLPGIGPVFATRIVKYRDLLGGFNKKEQLLEVYGFSPETFQAVKENIVVDSGNINRLRLNFANYGELLRHPYLEKTEVEAILNYREDYGPFTGIEQLLSARLVDTATYVLLSPYITCR